MMLEETAELIRFYLTLLCALPFFISFIFYSRTKLKKDIKFIELYC